MVAATSLPTNVVVGTTGRISHTNLLHTAVNGLTSPTSGTAAALATRATGSDQLADLQAGINSAATYGLWFALNGDHQIAGQLTLASGAKVDGSRGSLTQTSNLQAGFRITNATGIQIRNVTVNGKTTDYTNAFGVFAASGVYLTGTTSDVRIENCRFLGVAGAGVFMDVNVANVHVVGCTMTGAGPSHILNTTYNFSGGIMAEAGTAQWEAHRNDISGFAQGIVTGDNLADVRMTNNFIHDIPGQHGIYCETVNGGVIANNLIRDCALLGMKIQIGSTGANDTDSVTISDNVCIDVGMQGILLTKPLGGTPRTRRVNVTGNVVTNSGGRGIEVDYGVGINITNNIITNTVQGIRAANASEITISNNRIDTCSQNGITITDCQDWAVSGNRIKNPGSANNSSAEFGILVDGATSADGTIRDNKITDALGNMRYGIYIFTSVDLPTIDIIGNHASGATDYGYRGQAVAARTFRDNSFTGTTGTMLTPPTSGQGRVSPHFFGSGTPEAVVTAPIGSIYINTAGGASTTLYIKTSGVSNTGWTAK